MELNRLFEILNNMIYLLSTKKRSNFAGICSVLNYMRRERIISIDEFVSVKTILFNNFPTSTNYYKKFTQNKYWRNNKHGYWWQPTNIYLTVFSFKIFNKRYKFVKSFNQQDKQTRLIRIAYLKKVIENIKTH